LSLLKKYEETVEFAGIKLPGKVLAFLTIMSAVGVSFVTLFFDPMLSVLMAILLIDIGFGLPFFLAEAKIAKIERRLPDVLHHIGTTLKTGGTIEAALKEVSRIDYGPITVGVKQMLKRINEGQTFEEAFSEFALNSRSKLLKKAAVIIIAAKKSGGALVETLSAMAEDFRALYRLERERKTKTFMQFLFIITAGCFVAPFVFGIVKSVLGILLQVGGSTAMYAETVRIVSQFDFLFKAYLMLESALSMMGAVQVREGKLSKAVIYIPIGMLASYVIYVLTSSVFLSFLMGS